MPGPSGDVTALLLAWGEGNQEALDELVPLVYSELRRVAHLQLRNERNDGTIGTTALVHETYLRLVDQKRARLESRGHFLSLAARLMRRVLVDEARRRRAAKRGGGAARVPLEDVEPSAIAMDDQLVELDEALTRLGSLDPQLQTVVELRYFGGLSLDEAAAVLGVSRTTVWRDWEAAKAWLYEALSPEGGA